jgi:poly(A) polymerase
VSEASREVSARDAARAVAGALARAGFRALFAGGCVRDRLMGLEPVDYDIATDAVPEQIKSVFPKARGVGEAFGVMLVRHAGHTFEVATFRKDGPYHDGRRPSSVTFSSAEEDAERRDFTVNGIFEDPETGEPVDFVKGRQDIAAKCIRAIGDPHARISEDRLRMLRAVRFAARFGFTIEEGTASAIRAHAGELRSVSPERVGEELRKMLAHPARTRAAALAEELGLDAAVFGSDHGPIRSDPRPASDTRPASEARSTPDPAKPVIRHPRLDALPTDADWTVALASWWLDREAEGAGDHAVPRPSDGRCASAIRGLRARLTLSNHETDALAHILSIREALLQGHEERPLAQRVRCIARPGFDAALAILAAEDADGSGVGRLAERVRSAADRELPGRRLPEPLLDGNALLHAGFRAGPRFKVLLDLALDAQIEGRISTTAEALALARAAGG